MNYSISEVLRFVEENDVKFIRLAFCDVFGTMKNLSIMAEQLPRAFETGISFDASAVRGFMNVEESDLLLFPDPSTLSLLPWRPQHGRVARLLCDIRHPDGESFAGDGRQILRQTSSLLLSKGYQCKIGPECEFYLFETDDSGLPTCNPQDRGGYLDIAPLDKGENIRREICLTLEEMEIQPESSHHEQGPGQNEIDFRYSDALSAADNLVGFKAVVRSVASQNGLYASFLPAPLPDCSGSGLHVNMSLSKNDVNLFQVGTGKHNPQSESFIAGILCHVSEITAFLNPLVSSYRRLGRFEAPKYITWSHQNRSQLIRIPPATGEYARMELRSPDPSCNPYLAFSLLLRAGLDGIEQGMELEQPTNYDLYRASPEVLRNIRTLPANLGEAIAEARKSLFVKTALPPRTVHLYLEEKERQWERLGQSGVLPDPFVEEY